MNDRDAPDTDSSGPPPLGACFGFEVRSRLPFTYLRAGTGDPVRVVAARPGEELGATERLQTWEGVAGARATVHLNRCGTSRFGVGFGDREWIRYDPDTATFTSSAADPPARGEALLWGTPAAVAMSLRGDLVLHAASVDIGGAGVLIGGPGGTGKTTLAAAFHAAGHRLLSDDLASCRPGARPEVLPGPPVMRLRPDGAARVDWEGLSRTWEQPNRIHAAVDPDRRGSGDPVPLELVVLLEREPGGLEAGPVPTDEALRDLLAVSFWLPVDDDRGRCFRGLGDILTRVPVLRLRRPRVWAALPETVAFVADLAGAAR